MEIQLTAISLSELLEKNWKLKKVFAKDDQVEGGIRKDKKLSNYSLLEDVQTQSKWPDWFPVAERSKKWIFLKNQPLETL